MSENWNVLKEKKLDVPSPLPSTFTVSSVGLGQLHKHKKACQRLASKKKNEKVDQKERLRVSNPLMMRSYLRLPFGDG